jgi:hypothetical protein
MPEFEFFLKWQQFSLFLSYARCPSISPKGETNFPIKCSQMMPEFWFNNLEQISPQRRKGGEVIHGFQRAFGCLFRGRLTYREIGDTFVNLYKFTTANIRIIDVNKKCSIQPLLHRTRLSNLPLQYLAGMAGVVCINKLVDVHPFGQSACIH